MVDRILKSQSGRNFAIKYVPVSNGCFVLISEDSDRIGAISVSISSSNKSNTAKVIPSKHDSMFLNTISEMVSRMKNGICIVSLHSTKQLTLEDMQIIMDHIRDLIGS
ncbi:MAG TPA: hypothetical protein VE130_09865 [Nitrososphaeraceae archaeon]|nr:hypothetical protein [Nitrososphaeraceae archaeon]